jgi:hypothetical protein
VRASWSGWRAELGWALIGLGILAPCLLRGLFSFAGMPAQDATPAMLTQTDKASNNAEIIIAIGAAAGLATTALGIWLIVVSRRRLRGRSRPAANLESKPC